MAHFPHASVRHLLTHVAQGKFLKRLPGLLLDMRRLSKARSAGLHECSTGDTIPTLFLLRLEIGYMAVCVMTMPTLKHGLMGRRTSCSESQGSFLVCMTQKFDISSGCRISPARLNRACAATNCLIQLRV